MRYALISDIHANLPALKAVLHDIAGRDVDETYHLGDLVGYAPWPNETVALLEDAHITGISGNYDSTVGTNYKHCGCKYEDPKQEEQSHLSFEWTKVHTSPEVKQYLATLPFRMDLRPLGGHSSGPTVVLVHGTPTLNTLYWTEDRPDSFCLKMAQYAGLKAGDVIAFGHTHKPWHREIEGIHFVNTGSVGGTVRARGHSVRWRARYRAADRRVVQSCAQPWAGARGRRMGGSLDLLARADARNAGLDARLRSATPGQFAGGGAGRRADGRRGADQRPVSGGGEIRAKRLDSEVRFRVYRQGVIASSVLAHD